MRLAADLSVPLPLQASEAEMVEILLTRRNSHLPLLRELLVRYEPEGATPITLPPLRYEGEPEDRLSSKDLETHLWEAANILRGKIDSSDFKHYIFALLFYKRLSDVWEEEYERLLLETRDPRLAEDPSEHRFQLPRGVLWKNVCNREERIGQRLDEAFRVIERSNPRLEGIFQEVELANRERFADHTLALLLRHFEKVRLRNADVEPDLLGNAYEYLIARFADDAGKKGGEFYTPKRVVRLLVECLQPKEGMSIYDPTCGSGGLLLQAVSHVEDYGDPGSGASLRLYGQEMNLNTWTLCRMNLFLHGIDDASVARGDTLRNPRHLVGPARLRLFDRVLANPPFSLKSWGHDIWSIGDPWRRDRYGCPPARYGDLAFVQHMLASLDPAGKLGVVLPHGVLFRRRSEGEIRKKMLREDLFEAVIALAPNLFYGTAIPACVVLMSRSKRPSRQGHVLFVDGSREAVTGKNQSFLSEPNLERLVNAYRKFEDQPGFARKVPLEEIERNDFDLSIARYVSAVGETGPQRPQVIPRAQLARTKDRSARTEHAALGRLLDDLEAASTPAPSAQEPPKT